MEISAFTCGNSRCYFTLYSSTTADCSDHLWQRVIKNSYSTKGNICRSRNDSPRSYTTEQLTFEYVTEQRIIIRDRQFPRDPHASEVLLENRICRRRFLQSVMKLRLQPSGYFAFYTSPLRFTPYGSTFACQYDLFIIGANATSFTRNL